jgi:cation:H+ antiporter
MLITIFLLALGFLLLEKSANWLIDGTLVLGKRFGISEIFLGLTIVAVGTSLPEIAVNVLAAAKGLLGIPIANVLGSNVANILMVIGATAVIMPVSVRENTVRVGLPLTLLATLMVALLAQETFPFLSGPNEISRIEGVLLLLGFSLYAFYVYAQWGKDVEPPEAGVPKKTGAAAGALVAGVLGLAVSADLIINSAQSIILVLGVSQGLVGATVIALGTSLPELATSIAAARRGKPKLLIGNIVGSNMINLLLVLGLSALVAPLPFNGVQLENLIMTGIATILLWFVLAAQKGKLTVRRSHGAIFLLLYVAYLAYAVLRG